MRKLLLLVLIGISQISFSQYVDIERDYKTYTKAEVLSLESKPGATNVIFLDIDTVGNNTGRKPISFTTNLRHLVSTWQMAAEDFRPFDVNVTYSRSVYLNTPTAQKVRYFLTSGGSAWCMVGAFGGIANVTNANLKCMGGLTQTAIHEIGHAMGLQHQISGAQPSYSYRGTPMAGGVGGNFYKTWTNGDHPNPAISQDDIAIIASKLGFRTDDHGNTNALGTALTFDGLYNIKPEDNNGVIELNGDIDVFKFSTTQAGSIDLFINPLKFYNNLHLKADLYDDSHNLILSGIPIQHFTLKEINSGNYDNGFANYYETGQSRFVKQGSHIVGALPAGNYHIEITNTGFRDEFGVGYSSYNSRGYFQISGEIGIIQARADFKLPKSVCVNKTLVLKNESVGTAPITYKWTIEGADITNSTLKNPKISFNTIGKHKITLTATNVNGTTTIEKEISIDDIPHTFKIAKKELNPDFRLTISSSNDQTQWQEVDTSYLVNDPNDLALKKYDFCLAEDCYDIVITNPFIIADAHCQAAASWQANKTYNTDDIVIYNNVYYRAKFWSKSSDNPSVITSNYPWEITNKCISDASSYFSLTPSSGSNYFNVISANMPLQGYRKNFCSVRITTDINDNFLNPSNHIFPNPFSDYITIQSELNGVKVKIINSIGTPVLSNQKIGSDNTIHTNTLPSGLYIIQIFNEDNILIETQKIIKH